MPSYVTRGAGFAPAPQAVTTRTSALAGRRKRFILVLNTAQTPENVTRSEHERHEHLGRALVRRIVARELLGQVALLDRRAVDEVDPGECDGGEP